MTSWCGAPARAGPTASRPGSDARAAAPPPPRSDGAARRRAARSRSSSRRTARPAPGRAAGRSGSRRRARAARRDRRRRRARARDDATGEQRLHDLRVCVAIGADGRSSDATRSPHREGSRHGGGVAPRPARCRARPDGRARPCRPGAPPPERPAGGRRVISRLPEALAQRMLDDERLELGDDVAGVAELDIGGDRLLERDEAKLIEPRASRSGQTSSNANSASAGPRHSSSARTRSARRASVDARRASASSRSK